MKWKNTASLSRNVSIQKVRKLRNRQSRPSIKKSVDYKSSNKNYRFLMLHHKTVIQILSAFGRNSPEIVIFPHMSETMFLICPFFETNTGEVVVLLRNLRLAWLATVV
jgi:hypothetical protein